MARPKPEVPKVKFGTTLPPGMPERVNKYAEREGMTASQVFTAALEYWMQHMDGIGGEVYKPTHREMHRRLEALLDRRDPALRNAIEALFGYGEKEQRARASQP